MRKASDSTAVDSKVAHITPRAAASPGRSTSSSTATPVPKVAGLEQVPLQVRLPRDEVRAIKVAAAERDMTISDFMLTCFHAHMNSGQRV